MSKHFNICCPDCFSKDLYKYGKDKAENQKYQCKTCRRQFINDSSAKQNLKCPICGAGPYLYQDYEHYSRFKCNSKKCNHIHIVLKKSVFYEHLIQEINSKFNFKRLRTNKDFDNSDKTESSKSYEFLLCFISSTPFDKEPKKTGL